MSDFSRLPQDELAASRAKGYVGLYFGQGVPILDRDLNLLQDLLGEALRSIIARYIGDGVPFRSDDFKIEALLAANQNNFSIHGPGDCLVHGIEVHIDGSRTYSSQRDVDPLTTPTASGPDPRIDVVYLDVTLEMVDNTTDDRLLNRDDVGVQTTVRLRPAWKVRVREGAPDPPRPPDPPVGHFFYPLARLNRRRNEPQIRAEMIVDLRQPCLTVRDLQGLILRPEFDRPGHQFDPTSAPTGQVIELFGQNFSVSQRRVLFGNVPATQIEPTPTGLKVTVPPGIPLGSPVQIRVITPGGEAVSEDRFTPEGD